MTVDFRGKPNLQRFGALWLELLARREGMEIIPGSVKIILKEETEDDDG